MKRAVVVDDDVKLAKAVVIPEKLLLEPQIVQQLALFFDRIVCISATERRPTGNDLERMRNEMLFLADSGLLLYAGLDASALLFTTIDGVRVTLPGAEENSFRLPIEVLNDIELKLPAQSEEDLSSAILVHLASRIRYCGAPAVAYGAMGLKSPNGMGAKAIAVTLKKFPTIPAATPWQDVLQFRGEEQTKNFHLRFRVWLQKMARQHASPKELEEEFTWLLSEYQTYMRLQHRKHDLGTFRGVFTVALDAASAMATLTVGDALKGLVDISSTSLELEEAEFSAPGREVGYLVRLTSMTRGRSSR